MLNQENISKIKEYFSSILSNYCLTNPGEISNVQFSDCINLPLSLSNIFFEMFPSNESSIYKNKELIIEKLTEIFCGILKRDINTIFSILDCGNKGVIIKSDVKFIFRNFYILYNKTDNGFDFLKIEIKKMFGTGKILLLNEFLEIIKQNQYLNLINYLWEYLENIKLFSNYSFYSNIIDNNFHLIIKKLELICQDKEKNENSFSNISQTDFDSTQEKYEDSLELSGNIENEYNHLGYSNSNLPKYMIQNRKLSYSFNENISPYEENYGFERFRKGKRRKTENCFEPNNQLNSMNYSYSNCYQSNFYCLVNNLYFIYKFIIYNGYIFYFKLDIDKIFKFGGIININVTHTKKISSIICHGINNTKYTLYQSSIISHDYADSLNTDIYSYNPFDIQQFSNEVMKYSKYRKYKLHYETLDEIGHGQFSHVYKCRNLSNNQIYAVKILDKDKIFEDDKNTTMIYWEKNIFNYIKYIPNKNIVTPIEYFENSSYIYFIYEYLEKGYLSENNPKLLLGVSKGLLYLHKNNILHRDIKPKNILIGNDNEAKIIDFGLSKIQRKLDKAFDSYGSLSFMAPEIFSDRGYNDSCDVWSFGITMYNLKYNNFPFDDSNSDVIRKKIIQDDFICDDNENYDEIIKMCLMKNEFNRFKIKDVVNKLEDIS